MFDLRAARVNREWRADADRDGRGPSKPSSFAGDRAGRTSIWQGPPRRDRNRHARLRRQTVNGSLNRDVSRGRQHVRCQKRRGRA